MAFTTSLSPLITSQLCSSKNGLSSPSHMALAKCVRNGGSAAAGKSAQRMKVSCMATSIPADRVPDMGKRQLPPGSGGAGGGVVAKDALGNDVIASEWIKTHGPDDRTLTQGLKGDPTYLVVEKDKTLATYGINAVCTHLGTDQTAQANSSTSSGIDYRKGVKDLLESAGPHLQKLPSEFVQHLDQNPMDAGGGSDIPIIDLSGLDGSDQLKASTIKAIGDACAEWGFFRVKNHGIGEKMISEMLGVVDEFFGLSLEEKMKYSSEDVLSPVRYGTSLNTPLAHQLHWRDYLRHYGHPFPDTILQLWPDKPPQYRNVAKTYLVDMWKLTMKLGGAISQSLGLEEGYFERSLGEGVQILACNYYPPCPEPNKTLGLAAHSDHGGLTILMENGVDGLQIKHDGTWLSVQDVPSTFVVNVGDYLEILSNGKYKSIEHRAVVNQHKTRISVAVGHGPEMSTIMRPVAQLANDTDQYRSVTYKDYVKLQQSITSRGKNALEKIKI